MKFCKQLHRMMNISDPEWAPYYTNYKMLKKLIKEMQPSIPPTTTTTTTTTTAAAESPTTPTTTTAEAAAAVPEVTIRMQAEDSSDDDSEGDDAPPSTTTPCRSSSTRTTTELIHHPPVVDMRKNPLVEEHNEEETRSGDDNASVLEHKSSNVERSPLHKKQRTSHDKNDDHMDTTDTTTTTTTFTHPSTPGMILSLPQSQHFDIRTNSMEQYFFRCLHFEVHKVSYFYETTMQDLYARYQEIHQSIEPVLLQQQQQSRITSTDAKTNSVSSSHVHATTGTSTVPPLPTTRSTKKIPESTSSHTTATTSTTATTTTTNRNRSTHYGIHHLLSICGSDSKSCVSHGTNMAAPSSSTTTTTRIPVDDDDDKEEEEHQVTTAASSASDPNVTISIALLLNIYKLSRDLLLLETYCIMAFTAFSKILKKHDKVTGHNTKHAFMTKIVIPCNFVQTQQERQQQQDEHKQNVSGDGPVTGLIRRPPLLPPMPTKQSLSSATSASMGATPMARSVLPNARTRQLAASGAGITTTKIPSLATMIDQCYTWCNTLSKQYETRQSLYGDQDQLQGLQRLQLQQLQSLQYDEYLFLHMIQKFQQ